MKRSTRKEGFLGVGLGLSVVLVLALAVGCAPVALQTTGAFVPPEYRIALGTGGPVQGHWTTRDLSINYRLADTPGGPQFSGTVLLDSRLTMSFTALKYLHVSVYLLDDQGLVLYHRGLPLSGHFDLEHPRRFSVPLTVPPGAAFMAFSYRGEVVERSRGDDGWAESNEPFWQYPLR